MILTDLENIVIFICFYSLLFATLCFFLNTTIVKKLFPYTYGNGFLFVSNVNMIILLVNRWLISKHFPLSNLYESTIFLAWSLTTIYFFLLYKTDNNEWLGMIIAPSAMLIYGFAILGLPEEMQKITLLIPALQSYWLMMHVSMMILSYAALLCGSLLSMTLLIVKYEKIVNSNFTFVNLDKNYSELVSFTERLEYTSFSNVNERKIQLLFFKKNTFFLINQLDYWSFRIISIGFPFLTIGIMSGAVWANEAWGSYWSWDPKETWALITWLIFAIYLHSRIIKNWSKETSAMIAAFGFLVVWVCYLGVNLLGKGLHSYGWFS
jgi:cytochrome c-type biogenesis protein CcsB